MGTTRAEAQRGVVKPDGSRRRAPFALPIAFSIGILAAFALTALTTVGAVAATTAATATSSSVASATPSSTSSSRPTPENPTIVDPGDITSRMSRFHGTGTPGDQIRVGRSGTSTTVCAALVAANGTWACIGDVTSGPHQVFTATDSSNHALKAARTGGSDVIVPPGITAKSPTPGTISGTGLPGTTVTVSASGTSASTTATVGSGGTWSANWGTGSNALSSGTYTMTATQTASTALGYRSELRSGASDAVRVVVDRDAPSSPRITSPAPGADIRSQPLTVHGTGETGAVVTLYADASPLCKARVQSGTWSCTTAGSLLPVGARRLAASQQDQAGNTSKLSSPVSLIISTAAAVPPATGGQPTATATPDSTGAASADNTASSAAGNGSASDNSTPPAQGHVSGSDVATGSSDSSANEKWARATSYDSALPMVSSVTHMHTAIIAAIGAGVFLLLVAMPLRALVAARRRSSRPVARLAGRNRTAAERTADATGLVPMWQSAAVSTGFAALVTLLSIGVAAEARYARLAIAVVLGTAVLSAVMILATRWAAGSERHRIVWRLSGWLVLAALVASAITRAADLSPVLSIGVLMAPAIPALGERGAARGAGTRLGTLILLSAAGWVLHSVVTGSGFWPAMTREFAITICVGAVGALVASLLPIGDNDGSALWAASRAWYLGIAIVAIALAVAVYSSVSGTSLAFAVLLTAVLACAISGAVAWAWVRLPRQHSSD